MKAVTFSYGEIENNHTAYFEYLRLRKRIFVDGLGWPLWCDRGLEQDQYDNPNAKYSLVLKNDRVVAGARLLPDHADWFGWSHMVKDVALGKIDTVPKAALGTMTRFDGVWECSRLIVNDKDFGAKERQLALICVITGLVSMAKNGGAVAMVSFSPPPLQRFLKSLGYAVVAMENRFTDLSDGRKYTTLRLEIDEKIIDAEKGLSKHLASLASVVESQKLPRPSCG